MNSVTVNKNKEWWGQISSMGKGIQEWERDDELGVGQAEVKVPVDT